jgi:hypothetical protein
MATFILLTDKEIDTMLFLLRGAGAASAHGCGEGAVSVKDVHLRTAAPV